MSQIYFDANATSAVRPEAQALVRSLLDRDSDVRNPSSVHRSGRGARKLIGDARENVTALLTLGKQTKSTLFFTSGGTESCSSLLYGFLPDTPCHIVSSTIEHPAILETLRHLERRGHRVSWVNPTPSGVIDPVQFCSAVNNDTALCVLMTANNETGAMQPIVETASRLRARKYYGAIVSDYTQAVTKSMLSAATLFDAGVDAIGVSAHKIGSIKGAGAVLLRADANFCREFSPFLLGGPQEGGLRAGTENVMAIAAFGEVARAVLPRLEKDLKHTRSLRDELWRLLSDSVPGLERITPLDAIAASDTIASSLSNTLFIGIAGCRGDDLVVSLDLMGVAASTGSACQSGKQSVSHVMTAMGRSGDSARNVLRLSLDWDATLSSVKDGAERIAKAIHQMRTVRVSSEVRVS